MHLVNHMDTGHRESSRKEWDMYRGRKPEGQINAELAGGE